jgi:hypothetical protein
MRVDENTSDFARENPVPILERVRPDDTVDVAVDLTVPQRTGEVSARFLLNVARGVYIGSDNNDYFRVSVISGNPTGTIYSFVQEACDAEWTNARDDNIPCPTGNNTERGSVRVQQNVRLEGGTNFNTALVLRPARAQNGSITGIYPALLIQSGDSLRFRVGCVAGNNQCRVRVEVFYRTQSGGRTEIYSEREVHDGDIASFNRPLNFLAGRYVSFIVQVTILDNPSDATIGFADFRIVR